MLASKLKKVRFHHHRSCSWWNVIEIIDLLHFKDTTGMNLIYITQHLDSKAYILRESIQRKKL